MDGNPGGRRAAEYVSAYERLVGYCTCKRPAKQTKKNNKKIGININVKRVSRITLQTRDTFFM